MSELLAAVWSAHIILYYIIIIILYPPAAATIPIYTYNIYNIHCSRESYATFGIQTTVNSDRIYTNTRTRFGDKNRRHGWTRVSYSMYHRGWCLGKGTRGRWNFLRDEKRRIYPRGQKYIHIIIIIIICVARLGIIPSFRVFSSPINN